MGIFIKKLSPFWDDIFQMTSINHLKNIAPQYRPQKGKLLNKSLYKTLY